MEEAILVQTKFIREICNHGHGNPVESSNMSDRRAVTNNFAQWEATNYDRTLK